MKATGKTCDTWHPVKTGASTTCTFSEYWTLHRFCTLSCKRHGYGYWNDGCSLDALGTPNPTAPTAPPTPIPLLFGDDCTPLDGQPSLSGAAFHDCDGTCAMLTASNVCTFMGMQKPSTQAERQPKDHNRLSATAFWYDGKCADYANYPGISRLERTFRGVTLCKITFASSVEEPAWGSMKCDCMDAIVSPAPTPYPAGACIPTSDVPMFEDAYFSDCDGACPELTATNVCKFLGQVKAEGQLERQTKDYRRAWLNAIWHPGACSSLVLTGKIAGLSQKTLGGVTLCRVAFSHPSEDPVWGPLSCDCAVV